MTAPKEDGKFESVVYRIDPHSVLLRAWALPGGVSAEVTALEVERPDGRAQKMVVRRHGEVDLKQNPDVAQDEFKLLQITQSAGLATPAPVHLDTSCRIFPTPYLVIEYIEGETDFAPSDLNDTMLQMATQLAGIHRIDVSNQDLSFLPEQARIYAENFTTRPGKLDESIGEGRIRDTLEEAWPLTQRNTSVLLHGDFWPGNVLWKEGRLAAVIDWEDAQFGDPLADVANGRFEILCAFGMEAMQGFTCHYQSMNPIAFTNLPYWDLCAALRVAFKIPEFAEDDLDEEKLREAHKWFVDQAYDEIAHG